MKAEEKEALPKNFDEYYKKYFLQNNEDQATKIWNDIICHLQTGLDVADELLSTQSREIEELREYKRLNTIGLSGYTTEELHEQITDLKAEIERLKGGKRNYCECGERRGFIIGGVCGRCKLPVRI